MKASTSTSSSRVFTKPGWLLLAKSLITWNAHLTALEEVLVTLYPDVASVERVVDLPLVNRPSIRFDGTVANIWHSIILTAVRHERIENLMTSAIRAGHF